MLASCARARVCVCARVRACVCVRVRARVQVVESLKLMEGMLPEMLLLPAETPARQKNERGRALDSRQIRALGEVGW